MMVHGDSNSGMVAGSLTGAPQISPKTSNGSFELMAPLAALFIGAIVGFGGSLVHPRTIVTPKAVPSQVRVTAPPRSAAPLAPAAIVEASPPSQALVPAAPVKKATGVVPAAAKSRLRAERRHAPAAAPRVNSEFNAVDLEHDFSFLPTGNQPPKERLKPLSF